MYYAYDICMVKWEFHFSLIMTVAYTGNLTSFMTNPGFEEPLDTPAKLLEKGVKLGMYNYQGSTTLAFGGSSNPEYCQIWSAKEWITSFGDSLKGTISGKTSYRGINKIVINLYPAMLILSTADHLIIMHASSKEALVFCSIQVTWCSWTIGGTSSRR